jgi:DNA-binding NtrC family response regulator
LSGSGNTTTDDPILEERPERLSPRLLMGLVLINSRYEPWRHGQIGFIDHEERSGKLLSRPEDVGSAEAKNMLRFVTQQPCREIYGGPLAGRNISRAEVHFASLGDALEIEHVGKARLLVDSRLIESRDVLRIEQGQVLALADHSMYLVVRRLEVMAGIEPDGSHVFGEPDLDLIVGEGPHAWAMRTAIRRGLMARDHFFLFGPTGSGKERLARAIHRLSGRKGKLIAYNAAHLTPTLAANTFFGNTAAYTHGEMEASVGLFGQAEGGTLFLDELAWAEPVIQAMLLRALEGEFVRQGESTPRRCDVLVVCATNRDSSTVEHDVLHRFGSVIHVPPLSDRLEDVTLIARHVVIQKARSGREGEALAEKWVSTDGRGRPHVDFAQALVHKLMQLPYGGNVRDLENLLGDAMKEQSDPRCKPPLMPPEDLSRDRPREPRPPPVVLRPGVTRMLENLGASEPPPPLQPLVEEAQLTREVVVAALEAEEWNVTRAAERLRITRSKLNRLIERFGIRRPGGVPDQE